MHPAQCSAHSMHCLPGGLLCNGEQGAGGTPTLKECWGPEVVASGRKADHLHSWPGWTAAPPHWPAHRIGLPKSRGRTLQGPAVCQHHSPHGRDESRQRNNLGSVNSTGFPGVSLIRIFQETLNISFGWVWRTGGLDAMWRKCCMTEVYQAG